MSVVNAFLARGVDAGRGMRDAAEIKYGINRDAEIRARNAFVQDRAFDRNALVQDRNFDAQQEHRNAMQAGQMEAAEAEHARWIMEQVKGARTPEQARAVYEWGMQDAQQRGFDISDAPTWEQVQGAYADPVNNAEWGRNLVTGQDAEGNRVFLQTSESGEVRPVEGYRPPGPSPKEIAQTEKARADARAAETKAAEAEHTQQQKDITKNEIRDLAKELLDNDAIDSVYGSWQGAVPSVRAGVVDAEAQVDRLVDMLTLENTSKMTGVLSESDIKILARAGSVLANKRISDAAAKKELERIAGVFNKAADKPPVDGAVRMRDANGNEAWVKDGKVVKEI